MVFSKNIFLIDLNGSAYMILEDMFAYPESMVNNLEDYKKMEEGVNNPMRESVEKDVNEERERSTDATIPTGLAEINNSPKFVYKPGVEKRRCRECTISKIVFLFTSLLLSVILIILATLYLTGTRLD